MSLFVDFKSKIAPQLQKQLNLGNMHAVPHVQMVKVSVGIGTLMKSTKDYSDVVNNLAKITGQKPVVSHARVAISNFRLREGMPVGLSVTLRGKAMYAFLDRLIHIVLPRVRDFQGLSPRSFDGHGNYSIGFREALVFPEINPDNVLNVHGIQITIVTTAKNDGDGEALMRAIGLPLKKPKSEAKQ